MNSLGRRTTAALGAVVLFLSPLAARARSVNAESPDVLVVGGTPAGIAAAITAAREGETVVLTSAVNDLGGTLTDAMMDQWDLNVTRDGAPLAGGVFAEMYARLGDVFTPAAAERTFAEMVAGYPRILVRYDERPVAVEADLVDDGRHIDSVTFRNVHSDATMMVRASNVIDATDSADVAALAGAAYDVGRQDTGIDEAQQAVTEMFSVRDVAWPLLASTYDVAHFGAGGAVENRAWGYATLLRAYRPSKPNIVVRDLNLGLLPDGDVTVNAIDVCGVNGLVPSELAIAKRQTEEEAPRLLAFLRTRLPGFGYARVGGFAPDVYVRETRHIGGLERLTADAVWDSRIPRDSIGLASYPLDVHPVDPADQPSFAAERHVYGIPFGTLVPRGFTNVLIAGPAISASHLAAGSARVIPTTIEEGEADAVASAIALHTGRNFEQLAAEPEQLSVLCRDALAANGVSRRPAFVAMNAVR